MASKARELANLGNAYSDGALSNRNLIINGAMQVWQRGTSQTTSGSYGPDRFWMANAASASRSTDVPSGFAYSTKLTYSASDMAFGQPIELPATGRQGQLVSGEVVTLSYYARVDSGTEAIGTSIKFRDAKFSSSNEVSFSSAVTGGQNATWTTSWTRYSHSFTVPTASATNVMAALEISGISKDAYITGVQLEVGDTATPFEHRSYGQELALCQRYYLTFGGTAYQGYCVGEANDSLVAVMVKNFPNDMRAAPTFTYSGAFRVREAGATHDVDNGLTLSVSSFQSCVFLAEFTTSVLVAGNACRFYNNNDANARLNFDAEL